VSGQPGLPEDTSHGSARGASSVAARLAALERENAELRARLLVVTPPPGGDGARTAGPQGRRRVRSVVSAILVVLGTLLAPVGAVAAWAQRELTDTDRYVATVAPLASDPTVQSAVAGRITQEVVSRIDVGALLEQVTSGLADRGVPPRATDAIGALQAPLTSGVESFVRRAADDVVRSDAFAQAWTQANRVAHQQLEQVMRGEQGQVLQVGQDGQLTIQLAGVVDLLKQRLVDRGLTVAARIPEVDASFTIAQSSQLVVLQNRYAQVVALTTWLPWVVLGLLAAGVLVAVHRVRTLMVAGLALAGAMVVLGVGLAVARNLYLDALSGTVLRPDAAEVVFDQLVAFLRLTLRTVGVLGLVVALGAHVGGGSASARSLRAGFSRAAARARGAGEERGVTTGPVGVWLGRHRGFARGVVVGLGALWLLLAGSPTPGLIATVAVVVLLALGLLELLARPAPAGADGDGTPAAASIPTG